MSPLRITIGSHRVILRPMCWVPSESWLPDEYFEYLQTSETFIKVPEMTGWKLPPKRSIYQIDCLRITVGSHRVILGPMFLVPSESWVQEEYFKHWQTSKSLKNTWDMRVLNKTTNISAILPCKITKIKMLCTKSGSYFFFDFFLF